MFNVERENNLYDMEVVHPFNNTNSGPPLTGRQVLILQRFSRVECLLLT